MREQPELKVCSTCELKPKPNVSYQSTARYDAFGRVVQVTPHRDTCKRVKKTPS